MKTKLLRIEFVLLLVTLATMTCSQAVAAELMLSSPTTNQVIQREAFDPRFAHEHHLGGPALGEGDVSIQGEWPNELANVKADDVVCEAKLQRLEGSFGRDLDWTACRLKRDGTRWSSSLRAPAGGWYQLEVRLRRGDSMVATGSVQPIGVGEVFVVAGQSYAEGTNDERLRVEDKFGRVVAFDIIKGKWQVAHDPIPNKADGGSIWPPLGDLLVPTARVPIGFVNVAVGGTASRQWMPGEKLFEDLKAAGLKIGRFRAVLWQQGESDVIEDLSTETYVKRLTTIRGELVKAWGFEPAWLAAKSTLHPTVYNFPDREQRIREAIDQLWQTPGFRPGPDTDILAGDNRGGPTTRRHFSGIGQRRAALLWFNAVWNEINRR
ncbi:MAG: hypothetical protein NT013_23265 [Planctomycetia bacterium]|nr:hypothetical protein [Planctomycetia bacterium]